MANIEVITKLVKAASPIVVALGYNISPEQSEAIAYIIGGLLTLAYSLEALAKFRAGK